MTVLSAPITKTPAIATAGKTPVSNGQPVAQAAAPVFAPDVAVLRARAELAQAPCMITTGRRLTTYLTDIALCGGMGVSVGMLAGTLAIAFCALTSVSAPALVIALYAAPTLIGIAIGTAYAWSDNADARAGRDEPQGVGRLTASGKEVSPGVYCKP